MFKLYKEKLMLDIENIELKTLLKIVEMDVDKGKPTALKALLYIFFVSDLSDDNPLRDIAYYEKREESLFRAFGDRNYDIQKELGKKWFDAIYKGIAEYQKEKVPDSHRDIYTYDKKMDQMRQMLEDMEPEIKKGEADNGTISYNHNLKIMTKTLDGIIKLIQTKMAVVSMYVEGKIPRSLRGGLSPLTKGTIKIKKK